jgi:Arc/MetJ-type ribon-helix-helix transcriptional regulator
MTIHLPENLESSILEAVQSGQFASVDEAMAEAARLLLRQINQRQTAPEAEAARKEPAVEARKPVWERIQEMTADVPDEEWDKLPVDLAEQHDHYIYGTPKRPTA